MPSRPTVGGVSLQQSGQRVGRDLLLLVLLAGLVAMHGLTTSHDAGALTASSGHHASAAPAVHGPRAHSTIVVEAAAQPRQLLPGPAETASGSAHEACDMGGMAGMCLAVLGAALTLLAALILGSHARWAGFAGGLPPALVAVIPAQAGPQDRRLCPSLSKLCLLRI